MGAAIAPRPCTVARGGEQGATSANFLNVGSFLENIGKTYENVVSKNVGQDFFSKNVGTHFFSKIIMSHHPLDIGGLL